MYVNIQISDEVAQKIEEEVKDRIQDAVIQIISENIDEVIKDVVRKQVKSTAIMYLQSPELRKELNKKVCPIVDKMLIGEDNA